MKRIISTVIHIHHGINQKTTEFVIDILEECFYVSIVEKRHYKKVSHSKGISCFKPSANQITFEYDGEVYNFFRNDISALGEALINQGIGIIPSNYLR